MKRFLAMCLALILLMSAVPVCEARADAVTLTVKGGWLRLRAAASFDAETVSSYYTGTRVTVLGTAGAWYYVSAPDGRVGYMYGSYLTSTPSGGSTGNENITAYVTSSNGKAVRMRTGPGTAYGVVKQYNVGTKATILSSGTYWHYVQIGGQKGYMMAKYLTTDVITPTPDVDVSDYTAYVTSANGKGVNLRKGPSTGYGALASYKVGTQITVHGATGEWSYITGPGGVKGYMMTRYITTQKPSTSTDATYTAYVTSSNGRGVNLRKGPSTAYGSYGTYDVGTQVTVLSTNGGWSYIDVGARKGYMMSKYLTTSKPSTGGSSSDSTYTAYVTSGNGKGVYLRSGAGQGYQSLGLYSVGTQVTVLRHNTTWDYIRIGSREGYMMNKYLTTRKPTVSSYEITGVTISDTSPVAGDTLWANVTPSSANVTYEWVTDNGLLLSSNASYQLSDSDVGRRIRVRVTGKNGYIGSAVSAFATVSKKNSGGDQSASVALKSVSIDKDTPAVGDTLTAGVLPTGATASYRWIRDDGVQVGSAKAYTVQKGDVGHTLYCEVTGNGDYSGTVTSGNTSAVKDITPVTKAISGTVDLRCSAIMPGVTITPSVSVNCDSVTYHWLVGGTEVSGSKTLNVTEAMAGKSIVLVIRPAEGSGYTGKVESNACSVLDVQKETATTTDL